MKSRNRQSGMSFIGMMTIFIMVGFFVMCGIRMVPRYLEFMTVKEVVTNIAIANDAEDLSVSEIRQKIANMFNTNQIYDLKPRDVEVYRKEGRTYIDAGYEVRLPVMGRIEALLNFNDLIVIAGQPVP
ncbi:MAG: hypothetical protein ACI9B9_000941 [Halioglobus sp.]|jgi:hypothetical protein